MSYEKIKSRYGYVFISLWLVGFLFLFLIPFVTAIGYSFNELHIDTGKLNMRFVGWENYQRAFLQDADFLPSFMGTLGSAIVQTPVTVLFSLFVSILLNQKFRGRGLARAIFFLPVIIMSGPVLGVMNYDVFFSSLVSGERASAMLEITSTQEILQSLGVNALIADYIVNITNQLFNLSWSSGIQILIFIAGLQAIPQTYYEVAQIEGATGWEIFWKVTLPSIGPMILVNVIYTLYDCLLSGGDMFNKIQGHISQLEFAYASALSLMCFVTWALLIAAVYKIVSRWVTAR